VGKITSREKRAEGGSQKNEEGEWSVGNTIESSEVEVKKVSCKPVLSDRDIGEGARGRKGKGKKGRTGEDACGRKEVNRSPKRGDGQNPKNWGKKSGERSREEGHTTALPQ